MKGSHVELAGDTATETPAIVPEIETATKRFAVRVVLWNEYDAADDGDAFEQAMNDIEARDGMEICSHEIVEITP